jgi:outer membrane lipoprotein-sorting protein
MRMQQRSVVPHRVRLCSLAMAALVGAVSPGALATTKASRAPAVPARLSAEQIVAKNVTARGGLDAWHNVQTMVWLGHIESTHATVPSMLFMLSQKRPNKMRFEINAMGDKSLRVFDGAQGWRLRPAHGQPDVQPFSIDEVRFAQGSAGIDGPLIDYAAKGSTVSLAGVDQIENRKAYHLLVRTASGETQHVWVDTETFLEIRYDRSAGGVAGNVPRTVSVVYRDYKITDGLQIPSIIETGAGPGSTPDRMVIERVAVNPPLEDRTFAEPGGQRGAQRVALPPRRRAAPGLGWLVSPPAAAGESSGSRASSQDSGSSLPAASGQGPESRPQ